MAKSSNDNKGRKKIVILLLLLLLLLLFGSIAIVDKVITDKSKPSSGKNYNVAFNDHYYSERVLGNYLILGLDGAGDVNNSQLHTAEFIMLFTYDYAMEAYSAVQINSSTLIDLSNKTIIDRPATLPESGFITLKEAYACGVGAKMSTRFVQSCVRSLFYNVSIDYYATFTMDSFNSLMNYTQGSLICSYNDSQITFEDAYQAIGWIQDENDKEVQDDKKSALLNSFVNYMRQCGTRENFIDDAWIVLKDSNCYLETTDIINLRVTFNRVFNDEYNGVYSLEGTYNTFDQFVPSQTSINSICETLFFDIVG